MKEKEIPMRTCTDQDFEKFYEPTENNSKRFNQFRKSGAMQCIDWKSVGLDIYGSYGSDSYGALDVIAVPCHLGMIIKEENGGEYVEPSADCNLDQ